MSQIIVITPPRRFSLPRLSELWEAREVLYQFGQRDIILRYRQTAIGVAWVLLQPIAAAGIFSIVFGRVAKLDSGGVPYFIFSYMGMLAWNLFAGVVTRAAPSLVSNQALVSKVFFPRMLVPLSTTLSVMLDFVVALGLGVVLLVVYGINPGWPALLLPVWAVLMVLLGAGAGLAASAIMVKYRDVAYIVPWLVQVMLFASPVAYSLDSVPKNLQGLYAANPLTWILEEFRWSLLGSAAPPTWQIGASVVVSLGVFVVGALIFQQFEREFADVI
ncbi:lipopolysaccharide transport system permease protein [Sanguibacter gelidistatuariae]|uniref:Transport permease protein n=1 Tax=Sanguibacter gelidistatuariae TaxID=1814289 RepID=A0A1G6QEC2_9MICO|nr:ABC transporter permease [Sanguibacter gelidistatuariae]SDC90015.1 lipopolysaccharide transport system permease protein [Sanguibacter gelidistatuariae]